MSDLKNYVSEDGTYIIPVTWSVASTVRVKADNLEEAVKLAKEHIADLPTIDNNMYIDGSYRVEIESDEEAIVAQEYHEFSGLVFDWKDKEDETVKIFKPSLNDNESFFNESTDSSDEIKTSFEVLKKQ